MNNGPIETAHLLCPAWPNASHPATEEEVKKTKKYGGVYLETDCLWTNLKYDEEEIPQDYRDKRFTEYSAVWRSNGTNSPSKELQKKRKNFRCLTHGTEPTKVWSRKTSLYYAIATELRKFWKEEYVQGSGNTYAASLKYTRIFNVPTIRNLWHGK